MVPTEFSNTPDSNLASQYDQLIQDGILAVKNGNLTLAKKLLDQAALINSTDPRIWIWLSATTEDLQERRGYLERAVALDPSNAAAKRGLLMVIEKLKKTILASEASPPVATAPSEAPPPAATAPSEALPPAATAPSEVPPPVKTTIKTYLCPNCGATISYSLEDTVLVCQFCGFKRKVDQSVISESSEQSLDAALPATSAHPWADTQSRLTCEQCGVTILLPPGQTAESCPYCASTRFVTSSSLVEMVDPQLIGLFKIDPQNAAKGIKTWLGKGLLAPDELAVQHAGMQLHPAYYPFWLFEGTLEVPWFCDVNEGTSRLPQWEAHTGSQFEKFKDFIIPGLRKMSPVELAGIEPFNLNELVEFSPDSLAGWVAVTYDHPLADASLRAREKILKKVQRTLSRLVEPGHPKRNFSTGEGKWSGLTYKLALLPIYIGNYPFQGKRYRLLVNGQTGKVGGKKPVDTLKATLYAIAGGILLIIIIVVLILLLRTMTG